MLRSCETQSLRMQVRICVGDRSWEREEGRRELENNENGEGGVDRYTPATKTNRFNKEKNENAGVGVRADVRATKINRLEIEGWK